MSVVALMLFLLEVPAEPATVSETFEYYEITGSTAADLRASLDRNGPKKNPGGRSSAGWTRSAGALRTLEPIPGSAPCARGRPRAERS